MADIRSLGRIYLEVLCIYTRVCTIGRHEDRTRSSKKKKNKKKHPRATAGRSPLSGKSLMMPHGAGSPQPSTNHVTNHDGLALHPCAAHPWPAETATSDQQGQDRAGPHKATQRRAFNDREPTQAITTVGTAGPVDRRRDKSLAHFSHSSRRSARGSCLAIHAAGLRNFR